MADPPRRCRSAPPGNCCDSHTLLRVLSANSVESNGEQSIDLILHRTLSRIFLERCFTRVQAKEFLRTSERIDRVRNSIIQLNLEQRTALTVDFSKEELGKLSLLWIAVLGDCHKSAELLVRLGADVNERLGLKPFFLSVEENLLRLDIETNSTVLHVLLQMDPSPANERLVRLVTNYGADLQARDYVGQTVLHSAATRGRIQMIEMLLEKGADIHFTDNNGLTPLLAVVDQNKQAAEEVLSLLIDRGADVFAKDRYGRNALHLLAGSTDLARVLIKKGVSINDRDQDQYQPIHHAVLWAGNALVKLLLDHGADVNAQTKRGESPLYFATKCYNNAVIVDTLLKRGANVDMRTNRGRTALHRACQYFKEANIRQLLSAGADVLVEDCEGRTPFALMGLEDMEKPSIKLIIKALALKKVSLPSIELKDERIIQRYPTVRNYYQGCIEEICRMKSTSFIESCTFFELLTKDHRKIAALMRNPEFKDKFMLFDYPNAFSTYSEDLLRAFQRAKYHCYSMMEHEDIINEAVYDMLPDLVVWKVLRYIFYNCCKNVK